MLNVSVYVALSMSLMCSVRDRNYINVIISHKSTIHITVHVLVVIVVWLTCRTPAVGGLIVCECVCLCVHGHVTILLGA